MIAESYGPEITFDGTWIEETLLCANKKEGPNCFQIYMEMIQNNAEW